MWRPALQAEGVVRWIGLEQRARAVRRSRCRSSSRFSRKWRPATPSSTTRTTTSTTRRTWCTPPTTCSSRRSSWYALWLLTPSYLWSLVRGCLTSNRLKRWLCVRRRWCAQHWLNDLELFASLFAALIHDFEHSGTNNGFHINSRWRASFFDWVLCC